MANLTLVYGMRLLPSDEVAEVGDVTLKLKNGRDAHVTMHVLEGSKEEIEKQLKTSLEAFFDFYPEIKRRTSDLRLQTPVLTSGSTRHTLNPDTPVTWRILHSPPSRHQTSEV